MTHRVLSLPGAVALVVASIVPVGAQEQTTITVDTTSVVVDFGGGQMVADLPGPDGQVSLREAAIASTNTAEPETIAFDIPTSDPGFDGEGFVIRIDPASADEQLTLGDDGTTLDATTQPGGFPITVEGGPQVPVGLRGLVITSSGNAVIELSVRLYTTGIAIRGSDNLVTGGSVTSNRDGIDIIGDGNQVTESTISDNGRGIAIINATAVVVDGNTITGNDGRGVSILGADEVTVTGNLISGNGFWGIDFISASGTGSCPVGDRAGLAAGNTITGNTPGGIKVDCAHRFTISRNAIAGNDGLGIDLLGGREDDFGVTRNDSKDDDSGPNQLMNYPEKMSATDDGTATVVEGRLGFPEPESVTIEFFANDAPDPSGHGEGQTFLGMATPQGRQGRLTATLPAGLAGQWITATATDSAGNTSEFSEAVQVTD